MKKLNLSLLALSILATISCQKPKDWTCTCDCRPIGGATTTETTEFKNMKMGVANSNCSDFGKAKVNGNGTWSCKIN